MKACIASLSIPGTFEEKISAIASAGFEAIEIFEPDLEAYAGDARQAAALIGDRGLEIAALQPLRDFEGRPLSARSLALDEAERKFDLMQDLGTAFLLVCSSVAADSAGDIGRIAEDFHLLAERAAKRGFRVGYEALAWGRHIRDVSQAWTIVKQCDHPNFGLVVDSFHALVRKNDLNIFREIPGERIFDLQISDAPLLDMDVMQLSRRHRKRPGQGDLDVDALVKSVLATGYAGPLCLEIFRTTSNSSPAVDLARDDYQSLMSLIKRVAG
jgi:4-hydroxyphenylpyruvate dioxygenase